jgi:hypothetical protein
MPLIRPLKDSAEGYEEPVNPNADGLSAKGFYPQKSTGENQDAGVERDESGNLVLKDAITGTKTLAQLGGGTGVTEAAHKTLLQLIHFINEGPADGFTTGATKEVTGTVFPTQILWKRADATKLVERNITWTGANPTTDQWKIYAADGTTVLATVTDTIAYSGPFETGRTRAIT